MTLQYKDLNTSFKAHDPQVYGLVSRVHTWAALEPELKKQWAEMRITRLASAISSEANLLYRNRGMYQKISGLTGVPWEFVAIVHLREAGASDVGRWQCVLHNGERIVGTPRVTHLVPKGRGPFATFEAAAIDALRSEGLLAPREWSAERMLFHLEPYNGWGYRNKGLPSPYIWSGTQFYSRGKYVRDGEFDPNAVDQQVGCAPVLHELLVLQGITVPVIVPSKPVPHTGPEPTAPPPPVKKPPVQRPPVPSRPSDQPSRPPIVVLLVLAAGACAFLWFKFGDGIKRIPERVRGILDKVKEKVSNLRTWITSKFK